MWYKGYVDCQEVRKLMDDVNVLACPVTKVFPAGKLTRLKVSCLALVIVEAYSQRYTNLEQDR